MRLALAVLAIVSSASIASATPTTTTQHSVAKAQKTQQVAGYYQGKKYCYTRGSATICN